MIRFDRVTKLFKNVAAVTDVSFEINEKEIFGLLGPNGAGKTTLILTMATVYRAQAGDVIVDGHSVSAEPDVIKNLIGIAFQEPKYDRILSAREILEWHGKVTGIEKAVREKRIDEVLQKFGIADESRKRTWMLSGGTKKKVENGKIFVQRPKIAVFDEPTAYLDVPSRLMVWEMIDQLRDEGSTILLATNMMDEADRLSDRVGIMNRGRLAAVGSPSQLKSTLKGQDIIEVKLPSNPNAYIEEIKRLEEVKEVLAEEGGLKIILSGGRVMLPHIINKITAKGGQIESVNLKEPTLEDVFIHYTGTKLD